MQFCLGVIPTKKTLGAIKTQYYINHKIKYIYLGVLDLSNDI